MPTTTQDNPEDAADLARIEALLGRRLTGSETELARSLSADKTPEMIARELEGAPIADPKKSHPEHKDVADE